MLTTSSIIIVMKKMDTEISTGLQVKLKQAEKIRKKLVEKNLLRNDLRINKNKTSIYFPIKKITDEFTSFKLVKKEFKKRKIKSKSYKNIIGVPKSLKDSLPTSFDIIGDIILIKIPKNLIKYQERITEPLLNFNKNIKTICSSPAVTGELRTRKVKVIAGEKNTETIHTEYGLKFILDVGKTYFSPRLATERKRVADLVKTNEIIVDMFAGVAPFSIIIAKYANPKIIYAIDKNKDAVKCAKKNIRLNNMLDKIEVINADAKEVERIFKGKNVKADRIIMNLPFSAFSFFEYALKIAADKFTIHYYDILGDGEIEDRINKLKQIAKDNDTILIGCNVRKIKTYAPREFYICVDITAKKSMPM